MKYPHIVVKNGVWYPSGAEVPGDIWEKVDPANGVLVGALGINFDENAKEILGEREKPKRDRRPVQKEK